MKGTKEPIIGMDNILKLGIQKIIGGESLGINRLGENNKELVEQLVKKLPKGIQ